jgi:hypothetical protein
VISLHLQQHLMHPLSSHRPTLHTAAVVVVHKPAVDHLKAYWNFSRNNSPTMKGLQTAVVVVAVMVVEVHTLL